MKYQTVMSNVQMSAKITPEPLNTARKEYQELEREQPPIAGAGAVSELPSAE